MIQVAEHVLRFIANIFISIGDGVLFIIETFWYIFLILFATLLLLGKFLAKKFHPKKKHGPLSVWAKIRYFFLGILFSFVFIFIPLVGVILVQTLPNPRELNPNFIPQTTKIYDRNGILLYQLYANQNRTVIPLSDIPTFLKEGTIAIEDKNFYNNPGFDLVAIIRAAIFDISHKNFQGASTITQQLVRSSLLYSEKSWQRKVEELMLAFWTEKLYSKDQILTMYFNQVPYGGTAWGIEAAAQTYFGKDAKDLDLAQSAFLAGLPQEPTIYSPFGDHPDLWKQRQKEVLDRMQQLTYITRQQEASALAEELHFESQPEPLLAPHFVFYVRDLLIKKYGIPLVEKGGLTVITSLDSKVQDMAQQVVKDEVNKNAYLNLTNGATVISNPQNGDILAMVGSRDYDYPGFGNFNVATALRQPGSSIKVVTYSAALSHGFTAATILDDSPVVYTSPDGPSYAPVNYDGQFHGKVSLRVAFANSFNVPAVKTLNAIGLPTFLDTGKAMGLSHLSDEPGRYGLSATLGGVDATMMDMTTVYGTIANMGKRVDLDPILKITDNNGTIVQQKKTVDSTPVIDPGVAFIISDILADNAARSREFGPASPLYLPDHKISVKTGTTDDKRDNWTIGYNKNYVVTVWVGNNDNSPMSPYLASGITGAAPIWHEIMTNLLKGQPNTFYSQPDNVIQKSCIGRNEYFVKGTENSVNCNFVSITPTPTP